MKTKCLLRFARLGIALAYTVLPIPFYAADKSGVSPTAIALPTGPGSVDGLGESFQTQLNNGCFTYTVPLTLPKVRGAAMPSLALNYNSGKGNGPVGIGWSLDLPRLQRQTDKGLPRYRTTDTIVDWTGEELVHLADGSYRCKNDEKFVRFEHRADDSWVARLPNGISITLGGSANSRLAHPTLGTFEWMISALDDPNGNHCTFTYTQVNGQIYLDTIRYGEHASLNSDFFTVTLGYDATRSDPIIDYRPGFRSETRQRCTSVDVSMGGRRVRGWRLAYTPNTSVTLLQSVTVFGDERSVTGSNAQMNRDYLPPLQFAYSPLNLGQTWKLITVANAPGYSLAFGEAELADLNADGLPDLLLDNNGSYLSALNAGEGRPWGTPKSFENGTSARLGENSTRLLDLRGDGRSKLLVKDNAGFYFRPFDSVTRFGSAVTFNIPGSFSLDDPNVQFVDINNDKAMDMMSTDGGSFSFVINRQAEGLPNEILANVPPPPAPVQFSNGWQLSDLNGDHLLDLVQAGTQEQGGCVFHYSKGWGAFEQRAALAGGPHDAELGPRGLAGLSFQDVNQDGWADLVMVDSGVVKIWLNEGGVRLSSAPVVISDASIPGYQQDTTALRFTDMNGNGSTDIVWNRLGQGAAQRLQYLELQPGTKPYLLTGATNELGGSVGIEYRSSVDYMLAAAGTTDAWTSVCPFPVPVVSAWEELDGRGNKYRTELTYRNAYYDGKEKEYRGFEQVRQTTFGNDSQGAPSLLSNLEFYTGWDVEALKGKSRSVETRELGGALFSRVNNHWQARPLSLAYDSGESRKVTMAYQDVEETTVFEKLPSTQAVTTRREFDADDFGNTTRVADYGRVEGANVSAWDDERISVATFSAAYPSGRTAWLLDRPVQTEVQDETGRVIARTQHFYDDESFAGGNLGSVTRGNATLERRWTDIAAGKFLDQVRSRFDGFGNISASLDGLADPGASTAGHSRSFIYDDKIHTFPVTETIYTGNPACPALTANGGFDVGLGVLTSFTDFNNQATTLAWDTFGRLTDLVRPGDSGKAPTTSYSYLLSQTDANGLALNFIDTHRRENAGGGTFDSREFFDGLGRKFQVRTESELSGQAVVNGAVAFNQRKGIWKSYLPYFSAGGLTYSAPPSTAAYEENTYDATSRVLRTYHPATANGGARDFSENIYEPLAVLTRDEEQTKSGSPHAGASMRHIFDGLQQGGQPRLREVQEIVKLSDVGESVSAPVIWSTRYSYNLLDDLTGIIDSQNNVKVMNFDALSRLISMDDPDSGFNSFLYDNGSNLTQSTDSKGQVIKFGFDGANRLTSEDYLDAAGRAPDVSYFYDVPVPNLTLGDGGSDTAANCKGRLAWVQDLSGEEHLSYDARGRSVWEVKRLPDPVLGFLVSFHTGFGFDSMDRLTSVIYPDGDSAEYRYNARSLLNQIVGGPSGSIISDVSYRASGQEDVVAYGNAVSTTRGYDARLRLQTLQTTAPGAGRRYIDFGYLLDAASNITRIDDNRDLSGQTDAQARQNTQVFGYDDLYRILSVTYPSGLGGQPGDIAWGYDRIGNMLRQTSNLPHAERGKPVANLGEMISGGALGTSGRGGRGDSPAGPHALTGIQPVGGGAARAFAYDRKGNMNLIDGLVCGYDYKDRLTTAENERFNASYLYDHTDRRVLKRVTPKAGQPDAGIATTTRYINRYFEMRDDDTPVKYVWSGGNRVARITGAIANGVQPIRLLRLQTGWNLVSLSASAEARTQLLGTSGVSAVLMWDTASVSWKNFADVLVPGGPVVLWTYCAQPALVPVRGPPVAQPTELTGKPQFIPIVGQDGLKVASAFPPDAELWSWDAGLARWRTRLSNLAGVDLLNDIPQNLHNGGGIFYARGSSGAINATPATSSVRYYHPDHLGSTSVITDATGQLVEENASYPFGHLRTIYHIFEVPEPYGFSQKEIEETDLHSFEARNLVSCVGRFNQADPLLGLMPSKRIKMPQALNAYSYVENRPIAKTDNTGLLSRDETVGYLAVPTDYFAQTAAGVETILGAAVADAYLSIKGIDESSPNLKMIGRAAADSFKPVLYGDLSPLAPDAAKMVDSAYMSGLSPVEQNEQIIRGGIDLALIGFSATKASKPITALLKTTSKQRVLIEMGKQGKHIVGHNNYSPGKSIFTHPDPQALLDKFGGTGTPVGSVQRGQPGFKERVNFKTVIGQKDGAETTKGIIHYSGDGAHIVPANP